MMKTSQGKHYINLVSIQVRPGKWYLCAFLIIFLFFKSQYLLAQLPADTLLPGDLKKLTIAELMDITVTSVSKKPEKLSETASGITVITSEDIRRSGATRLPEALRLAPNLQVAQTTSYGWAVTSRGFNGAPLATGSLADKLLVMIDGRSIYTPLFAGVYWDVQHVLLDDINRIEVVSGPGGTIWGANAVNGVINVIRKSAKETQGLYVTGAYGDYMQDHFAMRYGGKANEKLYYRIYAQRYDYNTTYYEDTSKVPDKWFMNQAGFRMDYRLSEKNEITLQGDAYTGIESLGNPAKLNVDGQNLLARWSHKRNENSMVSLQVYFDRTWREQPAASASEQLHTYDADFQHTFAIGQRNRIVWGAGYRYMEEQFDSSTALIFDPLDLNFYSANAFIQDEISVIREKLKLIIGTKLSDNYFVGYGFQPSARIAWTPDKKNTIWSAVSRSLRSPSKFDVDLVYSIRGDKDFQWEKVIAYEAGYRVKPTQRMSLSISAYYNQYEDLRSINIDTNISPIPFFSNDLEANTWGTEFSTNVQVNDKWKVRGGYTFLSKEFDSTDVAVIQGSQEYQARDPKHQVMVQSMLNVLKNFEIDLVGRYVSEIPVSIVLGNAVLSPKIPEYFTLDARIAWKYKQFELSVTGRNLISQYHKEFAAINIPRNFFGRITCRF